MPTHELYSELLPFFYSKKQVCIVSTALEEATARCASLMDSSSVHVTLPNGLNLPASPENRAHARKLWAEENGSPDRDEDQASAKRARIITIT